VNWAASTPASPRPTSHPRSLEQLWIPPMRRALGRGAASARVSALWRRISRVRPREPQPRLTRFSTIRRVVPAPPGVKNYRLTAVSAHGHIVNNLQINTRKGQSADGAARS
jgi:hypothetical protein